MAFLDHVVGPISLVTILDLWIKNHFHFTFSNLVLAIMQLLTEVPFWELKYALIRSTSRKTWRPNRTEWPCLDWETEINWWPHATELQIWGLMRARRETGPEAGTWGQVPAPQSLAVLTHSKCQVISCYSFEMWRPQALRSAGAQGGTWNHSLRKKAAHRWELGGAGLSI